MSEKNAASSYRVENDPEMMRYWMKQGPKTAAFLLVIPGCTLVGVGSGLLVANLIPYGIIGFGAGLLVWGMIVALSR